jgi:hypothetical protein
VWVEDGRQEKIETGETYPVRDVTTEVTLRTGAVHRGECRAVLTVRDEAGRKRRFFLRSRWKGEKGQKRDDLIHTAEVVFEGAAEGPAHRPSILLRLKGIDGVIAVHGMERSLDLAFEARRTAEGWQLGGLVPGTYDLAVVTPGGVWLWLQTTPGEKRQRLAAEDAGAVASRVAELEDFYPTHRTLRVVGTRRKARAVVLKERTGATSMSKEGERLFRRLEIWTLHHHGERWYVDGRLMLYREHGDPLEYRDARPVEEDARLGGIAVQSGCRVVDVDLGTPAPGPDREERDDGR